MIIPKEKIDASIKSKRLQEEATTKSLLDAIMQKSKEVSELSKIIKEIMETYSYVRMHDDALGKEVWRAICNEDDPHRLDFCNAILDQPGGKCGVRPNYNNGKEYFTRIFVTSIGVFFRPSSEGPLFQIEEIPNYLDPKHYSGILNSMCLLIAEVPAYKESLVNRFNSILNQ